MNYHLMFKNWHYKNQELHYDVAKASGRVYTPDWSKYPKDFDEKHPKSEESKKEKSLCG